MFVARERWPRLFGKTLHGGERALERALETKCLEGSTHETAAVEAHPARRNDARKFTAFRHARRGSRTSPAITAASSGATAAASARTTDARAASGPAGARG